MWSSLKWRDALLEWRQPLPWLSLPMPAIPILLDGQKAWNAPRHTPPACSDAPGNAPRHFCTRSSSQDATQPILAGGLSPPVLLNPAPCFCCWRGILV
jgi:hypothetical protein